MQYHPIRTIINCRVLLLGYKRPIRRSDLYQLDPEFRCEYILPRFDVCWENEIKRAERNDISHVQAITGDSPENIASNTSTSEQTRENVQVKKINEKELKSSTLTTSKEKTTSKEGNKKSNEDKKISDEDTKISDEEGKDKKDDLDKFSTKSFFTKANIFFALFRTYWKMFLGVAFFRLVSDLLGFVYPFILK